MGVDRTILERPEFVVHADVERGRIRQFATAIGEQDAVHHDIEAARAAGHPDLLAPPTFLFGLELEQSDVFEVLSGYDVDLSQVLHGEERFAFHGPVHAGETVTFRSRFVDVYSKSGGALDFVVRRSEVCRGEEPVADLESVTVIKNGASS